MFYLIEQHYDGMNNPDCFVMQSDSLESCIAKAKQCNADFLRHHNGGKLPRDIKDITKVTTSIMIFQDYGDRGISWAKRCCCGIYASNHPYSMDEVEYIIHNGLCSSHFEHICDVRNI